MEKLGEYSDAEREVAYLVRKQLVEKFPVAPESTRRRVFENITGAVDDPNRYSDRGYKITGEGIDAFREPFTDAQGRGRTPKSLPTVKAECAHKEMSLVEVKEKTTTSVKGSLKVIGAERSSSRYIGIFYCPECKTAFWKDVQPLALLAGGGACGCRNIMGIVGSRFKIAR